MQQDFIEGELTVIAMSSGMFEPEAAQLLANYSAARIAVTISPALHQDAVQVAQGSVDAVVVAIAMSMNQPPSQVIDLDTVTIAIAIHGFCGVHPWC